MATFAELNLLDCASCRLEIRDEHVDSMEMVACEHCGKKVSVFVFPALLREEAQGHEAAPIIGSESSCFYHADKRASVVCEECGRFLCELCDVEFGGRHLCSACLEKSAAGSDAKTPGARFVYYDTLALTYAVLGIVLWFAAVVLAPLTLYTVARHWNSPRSVLPRSKWRYVLAALLAVFQLASIVILVFVLVQEA